ncbi:MAG: hypothetical protein R3C17_12155 [Planctomycetaceae bacterium]
MNLVHFQNLAMTTFAFSKTYVGLRGSPRSEYCGRFNCSGKMTPAPTSRDTQEVCGEVAGASLE